MNSQQRLWWEQAKSDLDVLLVLRRQGVAACHQLHYLQMVTEKISKAYFWRSGTPLPRSHALFVQFVRRLGHCRREERQVMVETFQFTRFEDFQHWLRSVQPLAYELERLAPTLSGDTGPNPEYPWPHELPRFAPAMFDFPLWKELTQTGRGRQLLQWIETSVRRFPIFA